jgi:hypothetical protein
MAETGNDGVIIIARMLARHWDRRRKTSPTPQSDADRECAAEETQEYACKLLSIANMVDRFEDDREAKANGAVRQRKPVILPPRHPPRPPTAKPAPVIDVLQQGGSRPKTPPRSRTAAHEAAQVAEAQARLAHLIPAQPGQQECGAWLFGRVLNYSPISMTGVATVAGFDFPFSAANFLDAGCAPLTFSPRQELECFLVKHSDGTLRLKTIRLTAGARAARLKLVEDRALESERLHRLLGRPH